MNTDVAAHTMAQEGLRQIEKSIIRLLELNPQGLRNAQIADLLGLHSDFQGNQKDYLTYSVLGGLIAKGKVVRNEETKLFTNTSARRGEIDLASTGRAMYEKIRGELEAIQQGRVVVIDVLSGDYEVADTDLEATLRIFERRPNALTWGERVGYPAMYTIRERVSFG